MHRLIYMKKNQTVGLGFGSPRCIWQCRETFLFVTTGVGGGRYWQLVGGDLECCPTSYSPQDSPQQRRGLKY